MSSFMTVSNPLLSDPIRVGTISLTESYNKIGTITALPMKVSNLLFSDPIRVRTPFLIKTYNKTGTIMS